MRLPLANPRTIAYLSPPSMTFTVGTYQTRGSETIKKVLEAALACGYRSIGMPQCTHHLWFLISSSDTAEVYRNETDIGKSLQEILPQYGIARSDLFITSKLGKYVPLFVKTPHECIALSFTILSQSWP
jgi:hypothetical protein